MEENEKTREARLRRMAKRQGLWLRKSRKRGSWDVNDQGGYMIMNPYMNTIEAGARFDLGLDEVEAFLTEEPSGSPEA